MGKPDIDSSIMNLLQVLKVKRASVEADEKKLKRGWKTNCSIFIRDRSTAINIQTAKEDVLRLVMRELLISQEYSRKADIELGLEPSNKYDTFTFDDWKEDLSKRMAALQLREKQAELNRLEERLNSIVSPEQRRQLELEAISKELGVEI